MALKAAGVHLSSGFLREKKPWGKRRTWVSAAKNSREQHKRTKEGGKRVSYNKKRWEYFFRLGKGEIRG